MKKPAFPARFRAARLPERVVDLSIQAVLNVFGVVTMADNHKVDGGHAAMPDTGARLIGQVVPADS